MNEINQFGVDLARSASSTCTRLERTARWVRRQRESDNIALMMECILDDFNIFSSSDSKSCGD